MFIMFKYTHSSVYPMCFDLGMCVHHSDLVITDKLCAHVITDKLCAYVITDKLCAYVITDKLCAYVITDKTVRIRNH